MERLENVATPLTAATDGKSVVEGPRGVVAMAMVMLAAELVTVLLNASCTVTCTAGAMETPAVAFVGWTVKASWFAAAGLMLNAEEVAPARGADAAVSV